MQVKCESCGSEFWMSSRCKANHPKCTYCRQGMDAEKSVIENEMDDCWEIFIQEMTGTSYSKPDTDVIEQFGISQMLERERARREADAFFGETPSSDK